MSLHLPDWLGELLIRIGGSIAGISLVAIIAVYGNSGLPGSGLFDSKGGIILGTIVVMEVLFFGAIALFYIYDR